MWPDGRFGDEQCESDLNIRSDAASPPLNGGQSRQGIAQSRQLDGLRAKSKRSCFAMPRFQNNRFAFASWIAFVLCSAVGCGGRAAADAGPVQRKPHPL